MYFINQGHKSVPHPLLVRGMFAVDHIELKEQFCLVLAYLAATFEFRLFQLQKKKSPRCLVYLAGTAELLLQPFQTDTTHLSVAPTEDYITCAKSSTETITHPIESVGGIQ